MENLNLIKDFNGNTSFVVIPYNFFNQFFPEDFTIQAMSEYFEDYAMNTAMNEAKKTDLLGKEDALKYLASLS